MRPEEQSEKAESCRESVWNEIQLKGHKDRNKHKNGIKRNGQARLVYDKVLTATSPARVGEPVGTADTSRLDYFQWQYDAETEKERPTQPSCSMLNMTRRGRHWRLYAAEIQKKEANLSCIMLNMTRRG